jgi:hypothetical protein
MNAEIESLYVFPFLHVVAGIYRVATVRSHPYVK